MDRGSPVVRRHLGPAPPPTSTFAASMGVVMGDPLTVPEYPSTTEHRTVTALADLEPLWLKLPPELAQFFDLGFCHSEPDCPTVVFAAKDDSGSVEISGAPESFLDLAQVIAKLCRSVPCISHTGQGEVAVAAAS